jgi:hypothetical protein
MARISPDRDDAFRAELPVVACCPVGPRRWTAELLRSGNDWEGDVDVPASFLLVWSLPS